MFRSWITIQRNKFRNCLGISPKQKFMLHSQKTKYIVKNRLSVHIFVHQPFSCCACMLSWLQECQTLCDPIDCILSDSSVHEVLQARILEGVAMSSSRGSSPPRINPASLTSALEGGFFTTNTTWEAPNLCVIGFNFNICPNYFLQCPFWWIIMSHIRVIDLKTSASS